jgi:hypothetical protein
MKVRLLLVLPVILCSFIQIDTPKAITPLREVNYYPSNFGWEKFWVLWPQTKMQMDIDLDLIQELGANTVRIFLHPFTFGYPSPTATYLDYFEEALTLIDAHGLKAHVTLFDCWWSWEDISGSQTWINGVVTPHLNDPRIAVWELQNEVLLDQPVVRAWVQSLFPYLHQRTGDIPTTVSVNRVDWLDDVRDLTAENPPDIYSWHWYPWDFFWTSSLPSDIDTARQAIGSAELLLGEFGYSTYAFSEESQANLFRDVLYYSHLKGVDHLGFWTLYDFPQGTTQCANTVPNPEQLYYGIYRVDGSPKPSADILHSAYHGNPPSSPGPMVVLNSSFEDWNPHSGQLNNWWTWDQNWSGEQHFFQDCTLKHTGNCSAKLLSVEDLATGLYTAPAFPVEAGKQYSFQGYVWTHNLSGWARISISWFNDRAEYLGSSASSHVTTPNTTKWSIVNLENISPPPNASYFQVFAQLFSTTSASVVWFDDVSNLINQVYVPIVQK